MPIKENIPGALKYAALRGLQVLPVVRYRLSFARLAAQHVRMSNPDAVIAVDLPHALTHCEWLRAALCAFPNPSTFMIHTEESTFAAPIVTNDAACFALRTAIDLGRKFYCLDDMLPGELPDAGGELPDDESLPDFLENYFSTAWHPMGEQTVPRAARIADRLKSLAAQAENILFVCEWRLWPFVAKSLRREANPEREAPKELGCAIVPEDALLLWQAGFLDDLPALALAGYQRDRFRKAGYLRDLLRRINRNAAKAPKTTLTLASNLLETGLQELGPAVAEQLAAACLAFPKWTVHDLASGAIPRFGRITVNGIENCEPVFTPPDILKCKRLYPLAQADTARFYPPREAELRRYWGPEWPPPVTRSEAAVVLSGNERWSVGGNYQAMALAAGVMREEARRLAPRVTTNLFTPAAWIFCSHGDEDHRSVEDVSAAYRRNVQIADFPHLASMIPVDDQPPDVIHTLSATRHVQAITCPGIIQDIASGIGLVYTGPEYGPERYRIVVESGNPVPRTDPSQDPDLAAFELVERNIAFCIKYATGVVLLAHFDGFQLSSKLEKYAKANHTEIIRMPLAVVPRNLQMAVQRRVFLSKTMRWHEFGDAVGNRVVFWRIPDASVPMHIS